MLRRLSRAKVTAALPADSMWTRSRDELLHQTRWQRISRNFHRAIVEEPSWGRLLACALAVYTLLSVVLAAIVWALYTDDTARLQAVLTPIKTKPQFCASNTNSRATHALS